MISLITLEIITLICIVGATVNTDLSSETDVDDDYDNEDYDDYTDVNSTANGTLQFLRELTNITKSVGDSVKLRCEVKNLDTNTTTPKIQIKWYKNYGLISSDKRIKILTKQDQQISISSLRIKQLEPTDTGFYKCIASSQNGKLYSEGTLTVSNKYGTSLTNIPSYKPLFDDMMSNSREGDITTFLPHVDDKSRKDLLSTISNPVLPSIDEQNINNPELFETTVSEKALPPVSPTYNASQPFCQEYKGTTCKDFLQKQFVFVQPPHTQKSIEADLQKAVLVVSQSNEISSVCTKFALPSLCFSAFPVCSDPEQIHLYQKQYVNKKNYANKENKVFKNLRNQLTIYLQRVCREDCILLETELCSKEYAIAKRHKIISKVLDLEECENVPDENDKFSMCLKLGIDRTQNINKEDTCFWQKGDLYRGTHDTSISGLKCMRWAHQFHFPLTDYPELMGHSYCRNPGAQEAEPYCFIEATKKETCGLPKCSNIMWLYIIGIMVGLVILISCITSFYCYRKKNKTRVIQNLNIPTANKNIYGNGGPSSPIEMNTLLPPNIPPARSHHSNKNGFQSVPNYTYKEVTFLDELGEGAFGKVYKGELKTKTGKIFVAVKSLKENASAKTQADFQREIELISELKHPNIICLLGIVVKQEPMCMLFEYMSEGDLHEFLINNSPNNGRCLTQIQFLHIAIQIAQGMEYLSDNHYVHRDLAARNCLVSKDLVVKISDFGLSRDMYSCDYYRVQSKSLLPVRWMPPESILYGKFTTESDVWSYGVVLWEIYSYGLQPYYGYNNQEVINMIRSRKLLPCPESCPSYCYALMVECWAELALRRPSFREISHRLKVWKQNGSSAGAYFKAPEVVTLPQQKYGHSSKSSRSSESPSVCPTFENQNDPSLTWERNLAKAQGNKLNESQSSLTSRSSSLGNKTQSTNLSDQNMRNSRKSIDRKSQKSVKTDGSLDRGNVRNIVPWLGG